MVGRAAQQRQPSRICGCLRTEKPPQALVGLVHLLSVCLGPVATCSNTVVCGIEQATFAVHLDHWSPLCCLSYIKRIKMARAISALQTWQLQTIQKAPEMRVSHRLYYHVHKVYNEYI